MTSLQKAYEFIKSSPKLLLLCDLYVQISLFLMVGLLGLGVLGLVFDGSIVGLLVAVCITCPFVLQFYSLYKKEKTLFAVCSLIILGIYFFGILIFVWAIGGGLLDFLFPIVCCLIVAACNSFFWHYRRNDSVSNDRFRTFVMLELGFLHFLLMSYFFYFFANGTVAFLVVFELCTLLYIVAHKMFPPLKKLTDLYRMARTSQQGQKVSETHDTHLSPEKGAGMHHYFVGFFILYSLTALAFWVDAGQKIKIHLYMSDPPMPFMNGFLPVSIAMLLFCIAWGVFLLANPKGLGAKICTVAAAIASIPCIVFFFFKFFLPW